MVIYILDKTFHMIICYVNITETYELKTVLEFSIYGVFCCLPKYEKIIIIFFNKNKKFFEKRRKNKNFTALNIFLFLSIFYHW